MVWADQHLCVGLKREYNMIHSKTGNSVAMFPCGKNLPNPTITSLPDRQLLVGRDNLSIFTVST